MKIEDFQGGAPRLELEQFFAGRTEAWGMFQDRFGSVRRQFTVDIEGIVKDETLILVEDFSYSDGEVERRVWTVRRTGPDSYEGEAEGVSGKARGRISGNAFRWRYDFDLSINGRVWRVHFDDWMFLQPGGQVVLNRAAVSKWGIGLGAATLCFVKPSQEQAAANDRRRTELAAAE